MKKTKIAITTSSFAEHDSTPLSLLKNFELKINNLGRKLNKEETLALCQDCAGVIAGTENYDREVLTKLSGLKIISRCGSGTESIDLKAASDLDIKVINTPTGPTLAVAELTIGLIFDLLRNISSADREIRKGTWKKHMGSLMKGKNVGILGFGRIGQKVAEFLNPFEVSIAYYDIKHALSHPLYARKDLGELLSWADIITLHCAGQDMKTIIGKDELSRMKTGVFLINTSRGEFLDEEAVYEALKSKKIAGFAADTFIKEPYAGKLTELDNTVLTPHMGSYAKESRIEMEIQTVNNLLKNLGVIL